MVERRDPQRQLRTRGGRRSYDAPLTTVECAGILGVSSAYILGEIHDGRLVCAGQFRSPRGRMMYRIFRDDLLAWAHAHGGGDAIVRRIEHALRYAGDPDDSP